MNKIRMHRNEIRDNKKSKQEVKSFLKKLIKAKFEEGTYDSITIACIGTDRSTGDSMGPLVGHLLNDYKLNNVRVIGNLEDPLHAKNLEDKLKDVSPNSLIIAIDACLGALQNIGYVYIEDGPISPGAAMNKDLPKVGQIAITGIVNVSGALEFMVLQNTRLFEVMELARTISEIVVEVVSKIKFEEVG